MKIRRNSFPSCALPRLALLCLAVIALLPRALGDDGTTTVAPTAAENESSGLDVRTQLVLFVVLITLSAIFAGLTLGIMGLDTLTLEIIASAGSEPDRSHAQTILPVRRKGHQTLCTLVLGNMWANVMIAQFSSDINPEGGGSDGNSSGTSALVGFLVSTFIILIFTEVLPMSLCKSKNALAIAARGVPVLKFFMILLFPVAWPLGKILDKALHHDPGQIYDRAELKRLMMIHAQAEHAGVSGLQNQELQLMLGALEFRETIVERIMTPIKDVVMLEQQCVIDKHILEDLWRSGHSRVPVYAADAGRRLGLPSPLSSSADAAGGSTADNSAAERSGVVSEPLPSDVSSNSLAFGNTMKSPDQIRILGLVHVKDLIHLDPTRHFRAADLLETFPHGPVHYVNHTAPLDEALKLLQSNAVHMAVVKDARGCAMGVVTLEDLVEKVLKSEILDEYDEDEEQEMSAAPGSPHGAPPRNRTRRKRVGFHAHIVKYEDADPETGKVVLPREVILACAEYLIASVEAFAYWTRSKVEDLVREGAVFVPGPEPPEDHTDGDWLQGEATMIRESHEQVARRAATAAHQNEFVLYSAGEKSTRFVLVVSGGITITAGAEHFTSEQRSWTWLGADCLESQEGAFMPRFTASVARDTCIILIDSVAFARVRAGARPQPVKSPACPLARRRRVAEPEPVESPSLFVAAMSRPAEEAPRHEDALESLPPQAASA
jgi:metal transporter CNNM